MKKRSFLLGLAGLSLLQGCASFDSKQMAGNLLGELTDQKLGYSGARCAQVKASCQGVYETFPTSQGETGCACNH